MSWRSTAKKSPVENVALFRLLHCWHDHCKAFGALAGVWETCKAAHSGLLTLRCLQMFKANDKLGNFQHLSPFWCPREQQDIPPLASVALDLLSLFGAECDQWIPKSSTGCGSLWLTASDDLKQAVESFWKGTHSSQSRPWFLIRLCHPARKPDDSLRSVKGSKVIAEVIVHFLLCPVKEIPKANTFVLLGDSRPVPPTPPRSALRAVFLVASQILQP